MSAFVCPLIYVETKRKLLPQSKNKLAVYMGCINENLGCAPRFYKAADFKNCYSNQAEMYNIQNGIKYGYPGSRLLPEQGKEERLGAWASWTPWLCLWLILLQDYQEKHLARDNAFVCT